MPLLKLGVESIFDAGVSFYVHDLLICTISEYLLIFTTYIHSANKTIIDTNKYYEIVRNVNEILFT